MDVLVFKNGSILGNMVKIVLKSVVLVYKMTCTHDIQSLKIIHHFYYMLPIGNYVLLLSLFKGNIKFQTLEPVILHRKYFSESSSSMSYLYIVYFKYNMLF